MVEVPICDILGTGAGAGKKLDSPQEQASRARKRQELHRRKKHDAVLNLWAMTPNKSFRAILQI